MAIEYTLSNNELTELAKEFSEKLDKLMETIPVLKDNGWKVGKLEVSMDLYVDTKEVSRSCKLMLTDSGDFIMTNNMYHRGKEKLI